MSNDQISAIYESFQALMRGLGRPDLARLSMLEGYTRLLEMQAREKLDLRVPIRIVGYMIQACDRMDQRDPRFA